MNVSLKNKLAVTTALVVSMMGYGRRAYAACDASAFPNIVCSGTETLPQIIDNATNAAVSTAGDPPFRVDTGGGHALSITGAGAISFTDEHQAVANRSVLMSRNLNGLNVHTTGDDGATAGSLTIKTNGKILGELHGIYATSDGTGAMSITVRGDVTGQQGQGVHAYNSYASDGDLAVTIEDGAQVTGNTDGVSSRNFGSGAQHVVINGDIKSAGAGVVAWNSSAQYAAGTDLIVEIGADSLIQSTTFGIFARNASREVGNTVVTVEGDILAGINGALVVAHYQTGYVHVTVGADSYLKGSAGLSIDNMGWYGSGGTTVLVEGDVRSTKYSGLIVQNNNIVDPYGPNPDQATYINLTVEESSTIIGGDHGIQVQNPQRNDPSVDGPTTVTIYGDATGLNGDGALVQSEDELLITVGVSSQLTGSRTGLKANQTSENSTIIFDGVAIGGKDGIYTRSAGINLSLTVNGDVTGTTGQGIIAIQDGSGPTKIEIGSAGLVQGGESGITASSSVGQEISIVNDGRIKNLTGLSFDRAINTSGGDTTIENNSHHLEIGLVGTIFLGDGNDVFNNSGSWNTAGGDNFFGGGDDTLNNTQDGIIYAATRAGTTENTNFFDLDTFNHGGLLDLQDGLTDKLNDGTGDTTTIDGNFVGMGGVVTIDTFLGSDNSPTDLLVITGNTSGGATLLVHNDGGPYAHTTGDGIKVIRVDGLSSNGEFVLGEPLINGALQYRLFQGGITDPNDGDWYLRTGLGQNTPPYEVYPQILLGLIEMPTLQQRVGNRYWAERRPMETIYCKDPSKNFRCEVSEEQAEYYADDRTGKATIEGSGLWARMAGSFGHFEPDSSTTGAEYDLEGWKIQAGLDGQLHESEAGDKLIGGITAQYGESYADISSEFGNGSIDAAAYGVGLTATWYQQNGFYLDGQGLLAWFDGDIRSDEDGELVDGNDGFGYALSLEAGKRLNIRENLTLTPQAQLVYSEVDFDDFEGPFADEVSLEDGDSLEGRLGLSLDHQESWQDEQGETRRSHVYGIANVLYEFLDGSEVSVNGTELAFEPEDLWGELGLGGTYNWGNDGYSIYGEAAVNTALTDFADSYSVKGTAGLRISW